VRDELPELGGGAAAAFWTKIRQEIPSFDAGASWAVIRSSHLICC